MSVPWKTWCRLCASPNGGVPILHGEGGHNSFSDKIRQYLSISVLDEENISCLMCNKCYDQLATFDNFAHRCLQVQAMFTALCELGNDEIVDNRLMQIRHDYLSTGIEDLKHCAGFSKDPSKEVKQNALKQKPDKKDDMILTTSKVKQESAKGKRSISGKSHGKVKNVKQEMQSDDRRTSGRLKKIAEIKRAFGEQTWLFKSTSVTELDEECLADLLQHSDTFDTVTNEDIRGNVLMKKSEVLDLQIAQSLVTVTNKQIPEEVNYQECELDLTIFSDHEARRALRQDHISDKGVIKDSREASVQEKPMQSHDENCDVLPSDINGVGIDSLSDGDINDLLDDDDDDDIEDDEDEEEDDDDLNDVGYKVNGIWKIDQSDKNKNGSKPTSEVIGNFENGLERGEWPLDEMSKECDGEKKKMKTKEPTSYKCDKCDKSFHRKALLNNHLISHMPKEEQPYVCCKCARRFHCESLLRNHERVHLPKEERLVYPCQMCSKKFSSRSAVSAHLRAIHFGERPFVCHLCGHSFTSKGILQEHLTIHSDDTPWHCTKCSKRFKTKYRLKIHMDTHRDTPYNCPHCPILLSTRRTLRMHLLVHRDTKAYQCATCGKAFRRAKDLKNHHNLHTGRRPYVCPFCSRTFANGSNCRSHKRRMHPEELRLYEATLAANGSVNPPPNASNGEVDNSNQNNNSSNDLLAHQELEEEGSQPMKEDSQDSLLTEMALDLQQPQMLTVKSSLPSVQDTPVVTTAADLTLSLPVTLSASLPKLEPDDSRLVMNLTTQIHDTHDSMNAMSPLNLNIMSPLNLNISSVLHSPNGRHHHQSVSTVPHASHQHQSSNRYQQQQQAPQQQQQAPQQQQTSHQQQQQQQQQHQQQQAQQLTMQQTQHQPTHQQTQQHHHHLPQQPQLHQLHQHHHQQQHMPRSTLQVPSLQATLSSPSSVHAVPSQPHNQLPVAHHNHTTHHTPQPQTYIPHNQQGTATGMYSHHVPQTAHVQDSMSPAALMAAAAMAHSMATASSTTIPAFPGNPYIHHSMSYGRGGNM